jgi:hypothetical protein
MHSWSLSQALGIDSIPICWKLEIFPQGVGFAQREKFCEERRGTFVPLVEGFLVLVEPLFRLPQEGKGKQTKPDGISYDSSYHYGFAQLKEVLEMSVGVLVWLTTEWASLHHVDETRFQLKIHIPNIDVGSDGHVGG